MLIIPKYIDQKKRIKTKQSNRITKKVKRVYIEPKNDYIKPYNWL